MLCNPFISWVELYSYMLMDKWIFKCKFSNLIRTWLFVLTIKAPLSNSLLKPSIMLLLFLPAFSTTLPSFIHYPTTPTYKYTYYISVCVYIHTYIYASYIHLYIIYVCVYICACTRTSNFVW